MSRIRTHSAVSRRWIAPSATSKAESAPEIGTAFLSEHVDVSRTEQRLKLGGGHVSDVSSSAADLPPRLRGLSISHMANAAGVTPQAVRYYTRLGLLRCRSRQDLPLKRFARYELCRLKFIKGMGRLGYGLNDISRLLLWSECRQIYRGALLNVLSREPAQAYRDACTERAQRKLLRRARHSWGAQREAPILGRDIRLLIAMFAALDS